MDESNSEVRFRPVHRSSTLATGLTRRQAVAGIGAGFTGVMAGCLDFRVGGPPDDQAYDRLQVTAVYLDEGVPLAIPDEIQTVNAPSNADLIVLADDTGTDTEQAADWLADDHVLALVGDSAEATWLSWAESDDLNDTFRVEGVSDAEPDPYLVVVTAIGLDLTTYRHSWSDPPRDRDLLRALDEVLADIETRTPR